MYFRLITFLFVTFLIALPATASAQAVTVLGINSIDGDDEPARLLTTALRLALVDQGCSVSEREVALSQMQLAFSDGDTCDVLGAACLESIANHLSTGSLVFGVMRRVFTDVGQELEVELHYFDRLERRIIARHTARLSITASAEEISVIARTAAPALVDCVRRTSAEPVVDVPVDEDEPSDPVDPPDPIRDPHPASSYNHEWAGWSLIGLGAVLLIADIPVWLRLNDLSSDPSFVDYRHRLAFGATGDACSNASAGNTLDVPGLDPAAAGMQVGHVRSVCSEGATLEVLQYVFLIAGIASAGAGATLLATGVLVSPSVSTDHATLTVSGSF